MADDDPRVLADVPRGLRLAARGQGPITYEMRPGTARLLADVIEDGLREEAMRRDARDELDAELGAIRERAWVAQYALERRAAEDERAVNSLLYLILVMAAALWVVNAAHALFDLLARVPAVSGVPA